MMLSMSQVQPSKVSIVLSSPLTPQNVIFWPVQSTVHSRVQSPGVTKSFQAKTFPLTHTHSLPCILQKVYVAIDEPDGVAGVAAVRTAQLSLNEQILQYESTGK